MTIDQQRLNDFIGKAVGDLSAVNVAHFFSRDGAEIREAGRVLRPGGAMAIYATHRSTMAEWKFAGNDTHALFDADGPHALALRGGCDRAQICIRNIDLPFGIRGLIALKKTPRTALYAANLTRT
jgi:hypothetical protein